MFAHIFMLCNKCHIEYIWLVINYPYREICILSIYRLIVLMYSLALIKYVLSKLAQIKNTCITFQIIKQPKIFQHKVGTLYDI